MAAAVVKFHGFYALGVLYPPAELLGLFKGDVLHHDLGGAEGGKFLLHQLQTLAGLGILREIIGQAVVHLHPVSRKGAENRCGQKGKKQYVSFIHNEGGNALHQAHLFLYFHKHHLSIISLSYIKILKIYLDNLDFLYGREYFNNFFIAIFSLLL